MIESGFINEVEGLLREGYSPELKPMKAIGYRHIVGYIKGRWDIDEATRLIQRDTRRYAKRQLTWFRADPDTIWVDPDYKPGIINEVLAFIRATS
jgi:tRNA dimethylallyltransferase